MSLFYSPGRSGFFDDRIHSELPVDAIPITAAEHAALLAGQSAGKTIRVGRSGRPVAVKPDIDLDTRRARTVAAIKGEAARRILDVASMIVQTNDNAAIALAAVDLAANGSTTIDVAPAIARRHRIDAIRAASDAAEVALAALTARALAAFIPSAAAHWPA